MMSDYENDIYDEFEENELDEGTEGNEEDENDYVEKDDDSEDDGNGFDEEEEETSALPRFQGYSILDKEEDNLHDGFSRVTTDSVDMFSSRDEKPDIAKLGINEIKSSGRFSPEERAAEYRRRGKSPSGVIDGEYNDEYRGNDEYNDEYRDWDANA
jgi:hypothetical protein